MEYIQAMEKILINKATYKERKKDSTRSIKKQANKIIDALAKILSCSRMQLKDTKNTSFKFQSYMI